MLIFVTIILALLFTIFCLRMFFFSFRAQSPSDYAGTTPEFDLKKHLSGKMVSDGLVYGPTGRVKKSFMIEMNCDWEGDNGTLSERFVFSDGRVQNREWNLKAGPDKTFTATADDIKGTAQGAVSGSALVIDYTIVLPKEIGGQTWNGTDWMHLTESGTIMLRAEMRRFGIKIAELIATIRPAAD